MKEPPPETPEEIEAWLEWFFSLEPLELTPEEEAITGLPRARCISQEPLE